MSFDISTDPPPEPPAAIIARFDKDGHPTPEQVAYEAKFLAWLKRAITGLQGS